MAQPLPASVTWVSDTAVRVTVPASAAGTTGHLRVLRGGHPWLSRDVAVPTLG